MYAIYAYIGVVWALFAPEFELQVITYFPELETGSMKALEGLRWMGNAAKATDTQRVEKANAPGLVLRSSSLWQRRLAAVKQQDDQMGKLQTKHRPELQRI